MLVLASEGTSTTCYKMEDHIEQENGQAGKGIDVESTAASTGNVRSESTCSCSWGMEKFTSATN